MDQQTKLNILYSVPFGDVKDYENNITIHDKDGLDASIREFGYSVVSITVDENMVVIGGHGTKDSLMRVGYPSIPILAQVTGLSEPQKKAFRLALNKIPRNSGYDVTKLEKEVQALQAIGYENIAVTGYNQAEIQAMTQRAVSQTAENMKTAVSNMPTLDMSKIDVRPPKLDMFAKADWKPSEEEEEPPEAYVPEGGEYDPDQDNTGLAYVVMVTHPSKAAAERWLECIGREERFAPGKRILNISLDLLSEEEDGDNDEEA